MWEEIELKELCDFREGYVNPSQEVAEYFGEDIKWLRANDLNNGYVKETSRKLSQIGYESAGKSAYLFEPNTLAISKSGTIGQLGILQDYMCGNRAVINIIPNTMVTDMRFIFYSLLLKQQVIKNLAMGSVQKNLYISVLGKLKILNPPLPDQQKIANVLSAYDDLIENNNRRIELLEKAAQNLYKEWFVRFRFPGYKKTKLLNGLPQGWRLMKLDDIIQIVDGDRGKNYPKQHEFSAEGYCLFLNAGNVTKTGFDFSTNSFISKEKDLILRKGKLQRDDIIMTTRGTVGNLAFYGKFIPYENIRINSGMVIIKKKNNKLNSIFLYSLLRSDSVKKAIELYSSGSAQPQLPIKDMKKIKIILPSQDLIKQFADKVLEMETIIGNINAQNCILIKQRDLLLPRLMSGKLEI